MDHHMDNMWRIVEAREIVNIFFKYSGMRFTHTNSHIGCFALSRKIIQQHKRDENFTLFTNKKFSLESKNRKNFN